jgi:hypothetical protein
MYVCPYCDTEINTSTEICPYCGADLSASGQPAAPTPPKSTRSILIRWGILLGIVGIGLWGFLWYVMPSQHSDAAREAEARVASALNGLHAALMSYSAAQPGRSFPNSLEPLGNPARDALQFAQSEGYQIQYTPAAPGEGGSIRSYVLQARPGNFGYGSFYSDESGQLHVTRENRAATTQDPPL